MTNLYVLAASLSKADLFDKKVKQDFSEVLTGITGGIPEAFSEDHRAELLEKIRERFFMHLLLVATEMFHSNSKYEFGSQDQTIISEALRRTKVDLASVDGTILPGPILLERFSRERFRVFKSLKILCGLVSLGSAFIYYKGLGSLLHRLIPGENYDMFFTYIATPLALAVALAFEHFLADRFQDFEIFKRAFGSKESKNYSGKFQLALILTPLFALGIFDLGRLFAIEAFQLPTTLNIVLFVPGLVGTLASLVGLLVGGLVLWSIVYEALVTIVTERMFGILP